MSGCTTTAMSPAKAAEDARATKAITRSARASAVMACPARPLEHVADLQPDRADIRSLLEVRSPVFGLQCHEVHRVPANSPRVLVQFGDRVEHRVVVVD